MEAFTICLSVDKEVEESIYREYKLLSYVAIGEASKLSIGINRFLFILALHIINH